MPSSVSSSFFTRILIGSRINFFVTSKTSAGMVADSRTTLKIYRDICQLQAKFIFQARIFDSAVTALTPKFSDLDVARQLLEDLVDLILESSTKHLISLVQHEHFDVFRSCKKGTTMLHIWAHNTAIRLHTDTIDSCWNKDLGIMCR